MPSRASWDDIVRWAIQQGHRQTKTMDPEMYDPVAQKRIPKPTRRPQTEEEMQQTDEWYTATIGNKND
jgi:hypothetical protein